MPYTYENQEESEGTIQYSARTKRELRRPPREPSWIRRGPRRRPAGGQREGSGAISVPRLTEWHDMTPGQRYTEWAQLRAWVTWLHDRYELDVEDKLPLCWPLHPGLVEELRALKAWRAEAYGGQPGTGQIACYWHNTLRTVIQAAATQYASGCRAGHRGATYLAAGDTTTQRLWLASDPDTGIPLADQAAGQARNTGAWTPAAQMADAYDAGEAADLPGIPDQLMYQGGWWSPASAGWYRSLIPPVTDQEEDPWQETDDPPEATEGEGDTWTAER